MRPNYPRHHLKIIAPSKLAETENMEAVRQLHIEFRDCLPIIEMG